MDAIIIGMAGFLAYLVVALIGLRFLAIVAPTIVVIVAALLTYLALIVLKITLSPPLIFWPTSAVYWLFALCFLLAFGAIYKSISLRILADLLDCPGHEGVHDRILQRYVRTESFKARLDILLRENLATIHAERLALTEKGRRIAVGAKALQAFFGIAKSG